MPDGKTVYQDGVRVRVARSWKPPTADEVAAADKPKGKRSSRGGGGKTPAAADPRSEHVASSDS